MKKLEIVLENQPAPERADRVLARHLTEVPARCLKAAFKKRDVKQNGQRISAETMVSKGDVLQVFVTETRPLDLVLDDAEYVIVIKPQGMPVQGDGSVEAVYARQAGQQLMACHRLDVNTGGLLLLAKHDAAREAAERAFAEHRVEKTYHAVVCGVPKPPSAALHAFLRKDAEAARVRVFDAPARGALPIETHYRVLEARGDTALLAVELITGRTHQIRAHLAHIGHPVLGDDKYGNRAMNKEHGLRRQMLWAVRLTLWDGRTFEASPAFDRKDGEAT